MKRAMWGYEIWKRGKWELVPTAVRTRREARESLTIIKRHAHECYPCRIVRYSVDKP